MFTARGLLISSQSVTLILKTGQLKPRKGSLDFMNNKIIPVSCTPEQYTLLQQKQ